MLQAALPPPLPPPPPLTKDVQAELLACCLGMQDFAQLCLTRASGDDGAGSSETTAAPEGTSTDVAAAAAAAAAAATAAAAEASAVRLMGTAMSSLAALAVAFQSDLAAAADGANTRQSVRSGHAQPLAMTSRMLAAVAGLWERPSQPGVLPSLVEVR